jgi:hypothetical protein
MSPIDLTHALADRTGDFKLFTLRPWICLQQMPRLNLRYVGARMIHEVVIPAAEDEPADDLCSR